MTTPICTPCAKEESHVCPRATDAACEWCSCVPAVKYVRMSGYGHSPSEDMITLCNDCKNELQAGLKRAVRVR